VPGSLGGYGIYTRQIKEIDVVDPATIRLRTAAPYPLMPYDLSAVWIISRKAETVTTEDFNIGRAVAGFGPLAVGAVSASYGFETAIALLSLLYLADIAALFLLVPERRGAELA
jgi:hypothetical protein